jgi:hypothetical protein
MSEAIIFFISCGALYLLFLIFMLGWGLGYTEAQKNITKQMEDWRND